MVHNKACGKSSLFIFEENFITDNYIKVLEETVEKMKEIRISDILYF